MKRQLRPLAFALLLTAILGLFALTSLAATKPETTGIGVVQVYFFSNRS